MKHDLKHRLRLLLFGILSALILLCFSGTALADSAIPISLQGTLDYAKAYEALNITNEMRKAAGCSPLVMDADLLEAAMQRAAEVSLFFSHTRPDGNGCYTASEKMFGENIAAGNSSASGTMNMWKNSPGHYRNIISPDFQSIGIGCFCQGSNWYWVQCFGIDSAANAAKPANVSRKMTVQVDSYLASKCLSSRVPETRTIGKGSTITISLAFQNPEFPVEPVILLWDGFTLTSGDPSIVSVGGNGSVHGLQSGVSTITIRCDSLPELYSTFDLTVTDVNARTVKLMANGGSFSADSKIASQTITVTNGKKYGKLVSPVRKGYLFKGWYTKKSGGKKVAASSKVSIAKGKTATLYAQWTKVTVGKAAKPGITKKGTDQMKVTWKKLSGANNYQVLCSSGKKFAKASTVSMTVAGSKKSCTFRGLKKGVTYYFKIRACKKDSKGGFVYGKYSPVVKLKR